MRKLINSKQLLVDELINALKKVNSVAVVSLERLPAKQLRIIRESLPDLNLWIRPKNILRRALLKSDFKDLVDYLKGSCALILGSDLFKLSVKLSNLRTNVFVKPGITVNEDVVLEEGPTALMPGEELTILSSLGVKVNPKGGKINILEPAVILHSGDVVTPVIADLLFKLGVKPLSVGLDLIAGIIDGELFTAEQLIVNVDEWINLLSNAFINARNLSINAGIINKYSIESLLLKSFNNARSLAREIGFITSDNVSEVIFTARAKALALANKIKWEVGA